MLKTKRNQNGIALIASLLIAVIVLITTSVLVFKIVNNSKNIVISQQKDIGLNIAEEGFEHVVDWLNKKNDPGNSDDKLNTLLNTSASALISDFYSTSTSPLLGVQLINWSYNNSGSSNPVMPGFNSNLQLDLFNSINNISSRSSGLKGQFEVGIEPITDNTLISNAYDLYKVASVSFIPTKQNARITRRFVAIIQRPKVYSASLNNAILSQGDVNLGNADTAASNTPITVTTTGGDVHTNGNLTIGPNGKIDGNASAVGTVTVSSGGTVTGTTTNGAEKLPIPDVRYEKPTTPCSPNGDLNIGNGDVKVLENCVLTGDFRMSNGSTVIIKGTVYIDGQVDQQGGNLFAAGNIAKLVTTKEMSTAGGSNSIITDSMIESLNIDQTLKSTLSTTNKFIFVSDPPANSPLLSPSIKITGNSSVQGLFVSRQNGAGIEVTGGGSIFGSIIADGQVTFTSNNTQIIRDLSLTQSPYLYFPNSHTMRIISWKEINI
jgi:hypothetical protein